MGQFLPVHGLGIEQYQKVFNCSSSEDMWRSRINPESVEEGALHKAPADLQKVINFCSSSTNNEGILLQLHVATGFAGLSQPKNLRQEILE